jgi:RNA polymerase sigma-70 factor (ECF subfamily)
MIPSEDGEQARAMAAAVARRSYGKLIAVLCSRTRHVAGAEDALSEAFATALAEWPRAGCPANPEGWLLTVARRKLIDASRRRLVAESAAEQLKLLDEGLADIGSDGEIPDRRLALMFACAHPAIDESVRAPLILQTILGFDAATIASAFLSSPAAMGKRLGRAKEKIRRAGIPLRVPDPTELRDRLDAVLDAIYAAFSEGWADPGATDFARRELSGEALYLGRLVTELLPEEPEALGLLALMLHAEARRHARRRDGEYVPLGEQDAGLWDAGMIEEAETLLLRASTLGSIGRFQLEGALQSAHVHRRRSGRADWPVVVRLYDALLEISGSPVVAINRALAVGERDGVRAGLAALEAIATDDRLMQYQPYWAARADLLSRAGARADARHAYDIAIGLERDPAVRHFLQQRRGALEG